MLICGGWASSPRGRVLRALRSEPPSVSALTRCARRRGYRRSRGGEGAEGLRRLLSPKAASTQFLLPALRSGSVQPGPCEAAFPVQPHPPHAAPEAARRCFAGEEDRMVGETTISKMTETENR